MRHRLRNLPLGAYLDLAIGAVFVLVGAALILLVNGMMRQQALAEAEAEARNLLDRNLAIHTYFTRELKPRVFQALAGVKSDAYFEPSWMSSTFAVRRIDRYYQEIHTGPLYYKEAAVNARSPENEADPFERAFLEELQANPGLHYRALVRTLDGAPFFTVLRRGEMMEEACLRCHSTPDRAPAGLVGRYGPTRSFGRKVGEAVSAISIRVPVGEAFAAADHRSWQLSGWLLLGLAGLFGTQVWLNRRLFLKPVRTLQGAARVIAATPERLGEEIPTPVGRELSELTLAFNTMSRSLRENRDRLEERVAERTEALTRAHHAVRESETKHRALFEGAAEGLILMTDRFLDCNPEACRLLRCEPADVVGKTPAEISPPQQPDGRESAAAALEHMAAARERGRHVFPWRHRRTDGSVFDAEVCLTALTVGGAPHLLASVRDLTERNRLEGRLRQAQKLESLGMLSGGIAHDFNNLLVAMLGHADLAEQQLDAGAPARTHLAGIASAARQAADLCQQMLAYAGQGRITAAPLDLSWIVRELVQVLRVAVPKGVSLRCELASVLPAVRGDVGQLRQVAMNLVTNAAEAVGEGEGVVTVRTDTQECDEAYLREAFLGELLPGGRYVVLEVSDTGCGMDPAVRDRIFDPFYSTKFAGRGLGLAAVLGIVRGHRGALRVYSEPGRGSTFKVFLPAVTEAPLPRPTAPAGSWRGGGTVLVVDDEPAVRAVAPRMLERLGFRALVAADGPEGLARFAAHRGEVVCILLDLTMPGMGGEEVFRELRRIDPQARIILSSGFSRDDVVERFRGRGLAGFLPKPYRLDALREVLQAALEPVRE